MTSSSVSDDAQKNIMKATARKAELQARQEALKKKAVLEKRALEVNQEMQMLAITTDMEAEDAKMAAFEKFDHQCESERMTCSTGVSGVREWLEKSPGFNTNPFLVDNPVTEMHVGLPSPLPSQEQHEVPWTPTPSPLQRSQQCVEFNHTPEYIQYNNHPSTSFSHPTIRAGTTSNVNQHQSVTMNSNFPYATNNNGAYTNDPVTEMHVGLPSPLPSQEQHEVPWMPTPAPLQRSQQSVEYYQTVHTTENTCSAKPEYAVQYTSNMEPQDVQQNNSLSHQMISAGTTSNVNQQHSVDMNSNLPCTTNNNGAYTNDQATMAIVLRELVGLQQQASLPATELEHFDGSDVLSFASFMKNFKTLVQNKTKDPARRLEMLIKYTKGEARNLIKDCILIDNATEAYETAVTLMQSNYGHPAIVATAYQLKVERWPSIKAGDKEALRKYAVFVTGLMNARKGIPDLASTDGFEFLRSLAEKLPVPLQQQWVGIVGKCRDEETRAPRMEDFVKFITRIARDVNDPRVAGLGYQKRNENKKSAFATSVQKRETKTPTSHNLQTVSQPTCNTDKMKTSCVYCGPETRHKLQECRKFRSITHQDKSKFCKDRGLCFSCLRSGHMMKRCKNPEKCETCGKRHHTALHDDSRQQKSSKQDSPTQMTTGCVNGECASTRMIIIPVTVTSAGSPCITTYAFMDDGCGGVFMSPELCRELNVKTKDTTLLLKTLSDESRCDTKVILDQLHVGDLNAQSFVELPAVYVKEMPVTETDIPKQTDLEKWSHLKDIHFPDLNDIPGRQCIPRVSLMIGNNAPAATHPMEFRTGKPGEPFAIKSTLGWMIHGLVSKETHEYVAAHFCTTVETSNQQLERMFLRYIHTDFNEKPNQGEETKPSIEDRKFLQIMEDSIHQEPDGHYQTRLPFRSPRQNMPNNYTQAMSYAESLKKRLVKNEKLKKDYTEFMESLEESGYSEKVEEEDDERQDGRTWYIPHHHVHNPKKPDKVRIVFNCPASFRGNSLNQELLQGPDMVNTLMGVLLRWRQEKIAIMADIQSMFYQVRVAEEDRDMLRYLWWKNGDLNTQPQKYRMCVHVFGAVSSPSCAQFALRKTAEDVAEKYGQEVQNSILKDFYVDDYLKSTATEEKALKIVRNVKEAVAEGGFNLTKWTSNSRRVLESVPRSDRAKEVKSLDLDSDQLPVERALGVEWNVEEDTLGFTVNEVNKKATRRNILSVMSSVYDPLGFTAPFILTAKILLQKLCKERLAWDDEIPMQYRQDWEKWLKELPLLKELKVNRCYKPDGFTSATKTEIHHFADASEQAYGVVSYIRYLNTPEEKAHCSFLAAKARVAPVKAVTIPRLELTAATTAVRVNTMVMKELEVPVDEVHFWTDSQAVLRYIHNEKTRFKTFVANRLQVIHEGSHPSQWHYIETDRNPADDASRGLTMDSLLQSSRWFDGPEFLWQVQSNWPAWPPKQDPEVLKEDPEVKSVSVNTAIINKSKSATNKPKTEQVKDTVSQIIHHYSNWLALKRAVAWWIRLKKMLQQRSKGQEANQESKYLSVDELQYAEEVIIQKVQREAFPEEIRALAKCNKELERPEDKDLIKQQSRHPKINISKTSNLLPLNPDLSEGLLRVGGRLQNANISERAKHQLILPSHHHVVDLILKHLHQICGHQGRNHVLSELRKKYWVIKAGVAVKNLVKKCVVCRRQNARVIEQKMADLPSCRVKSEVPPFTFTGMDYFGPFEVKQGRSIKKRYGVVFTCMASRAIHIEIASSLDTSSCINALRRFISRRGPVQEITSDNGTNLVGANHELQQAIQELNKEDIHRFAAKQDIKWKFNTPTASHHGGVWERQIRTIRKILQSLLCEQHLKVARSEEQLHTLLCEVEYTVNNRPLTKSSPDTEDLDVITPNHLLQLKTPENLPPGKFIQEDQYARRRWRQVQYLADVFWKRWTHEYLPELQKRQKWLKPQRNIQVGDIVLVIDDRAPRNSWLMGRVLKCYEDKKGLVRSVQLKTKTATLDRPVSKLCLLLEQDE